jgi:glyoxylase-like metal-dependent hydrolase (beta-lactamase superfamily II)
MNLSFVRRLALGAALAVPGSLCAQSSVTLASAIEGRRVIDQMVAAMGGRQALRSIRTITTDETIRKADGGQGLNPKAPGVVEGWRAVRFDVVGQRINELRTLDITGHQLWDQQRFITPTAGTAVFWSTMTKDSIPVASLPRERAAFGRRHLLPLVMSLERRLDAVRLLGRTTVNGNAQDVLAVTDADGVQLSLVVDRKTHLPTRLEQLVIGSSIGDTVEVSSFSDYRRVGALLLPFRRDELRNPDIEWEYRVQRYEIDTPIADTTFNIPPNLTPAAAPLTRMTKLAPDVYLTPNSYESVFVVFDDYVVVLEGGGSSAQTRATVARIREVAPGKPIRYVVATHYHDDHLAGLRTYIAEGITIVTTPDAKGRIEALARARYSALVPDSLDLAPRAPVIELVDRDRVFKDARHEVRLYQIGPTAHVDQILIGYLPAERLLFEGDLLDVPNGQPAAGGDDTAELARKIRELGIAFDRIVPVHGNPGPAAFLDQSLRRGMARAKCPLGSNRRMPCMVDGDAGPAAPERKPAPFSGPGSERVDTRPRPPAS